MTEVEGGMGAGEEEEEESYSDESADRDDGDQDMDGEAPEAQAADGEVGGGSSAATERVATPPEAALRPSDADSVRAVALSDLAPQPSADTPLEQAGTRPSSSLARSDGATPHNLSRPPDDDAEKAEVKALLADFVDDADAANEVPTAGQEDAGVEGDVGAAASGGGASGCSAPARRKLPGEREREVAKGPQPSLKIIERELHQIEWLEDRRDRGFVLDAEELAQLRSKGRLLSWLRDAEKRHMIRINGNRQLYTGPKPTPAESTTIEAAAAANASGGSASESKGGAVNEYDNEQPWNGRHQLTFENDGMSKNLRSYFDRRIDYREPTYPALGALRPTWRLSDQAPSLDERARERGVTASYSVTAPRELPPPPEPPPPHRRPRESCNVQPTDGVFDRLWADADRSRQPKPEGASLSLSRSGRCATASAGQHPPVGSDVFTAYPSTFRSLSEPKLEATGESPARPSWDERHHLTWSNELSLLFPLRSGAGKYLLPPVVRAYFDRPRQERDRENPADPPEPVWRLDPHGDQWRREAAASASKASSTAAQFFSGEFLRSMSAPGGNRGESTKQARLPLHVRAACKLSPRLTKPKSIAVPRMSSPIRDPERPFLPGPGGGGFPCERISELEPPLDSAVNDRGMPLSPMAQTRCKRWHKRHELTFKNAEVSPLDRSYFDRWRDPAALTADVKKTKGHVQGWSSLVWSLERSASLQESAQKISDGGDRHKKEVGRWDPRHVKVFENAPDGNSLQPNTRSYFDRWREPMQDASGPPGQLMLEYFSTSRESKTFNDPTESSLRSKRDKLLESDKVLVKWRLVESESTEDSASMQALASDNFQPGCYICTTLAANIRDGPDANATVLGHLVRGQEVVLLAIKVISGATRGLAERGGWVSLTAGGGAADGAMLFDRKGDVDFEALQGSWRSNISGLPLFEETSAEGKPCSTLTKTKVITVSKVAAGDDEGFAGAVFGKTADGWALLFSPLRGLLAEKIVRGYNEKSRKSSKAPEPLTSLRKSASEGGLTAQDAKLERRRLAHLAEGGRQDTVKSLRRAAKVEQKREQAWFSSHGIIF